MDETVTGIVEALGRFLDLAGVLAITVGFVLAVLLVAPALARGDRTSAYRRFRVGLARAIVLGLEILVAADIIRTVALEPTLENAAVLGIIVLVRTILSFTLTVEIEGRWPWQPLRAAVADGERID
jgi:uncharacterized membrane protein